jgi:hypothetical protein
MSEQELGVRFSDAIRRLNSRGGGLPPTLPGLSGCGVSLELTQSRSFSLTMNAAAGTIGRAAWVSRSQLAPLLACQTPLKPTPPS